MDRNEAMLRELNLYPQWTLREESHAGRAPTYVEDAQPPTEVAPIERVDVGTSPARDSSTGSDVCSTTKFMGRTDDAESHAGRAPTETEVAPFSPASTWSELKQQVRDCQRCGLRGGCTQTVFGVGNEQADWLFVGEGPGADEDAQGEPFVGQAGKLLDNMLMAIKLARGKQAYIANIVKCRPPNNRNPAADEIAQCLPYLQRQIELIQPKLIVALGKVAANNLLGEDVPLGSLRGTLHDYHGIPLIVTYHPAYLLRSPSEKAKAWEDLCFAVDVMNEVGSD
jgi:DNA polymerase